MERCLYRFATEPRKESNSSSNFTQQSKSSGVVVHTSPWTLVKNIESNQGEDSNCQFAETILTAMTLPCLETLTNSNSNTPSSRRVSYPLRMRVGQWHLVCLSHVCPYLKRPQWSVTVDGSVLFSSELDYPTLSTASKLSTNSEASMMQSHVYFQNICAGGILCEHDNGVTTTAATSFNTSISNFDDSLRNVKSTIRPFSLDVSGLGVYPDAISPNVLAVVAASTRGSCLTSFGMIPCIPPVANWSKGSSASEGLPKVGIPLMVHATCLDIQKLSDRLVFGVSANESYVVGCDEKTVSSCGNEGGNGNDNSHGDSQQPHQRIILTMSPQPGSMSDTPRVGLVQPGQPVRMDKDDLPSLYVTGNCTLTRSMDAFRRVFGNDGGGAKNVELATTMAPWSVALQDQGLISAVVLPFFLALTPPGKIYGAQESLYLDSIRQLHDLYSDNGFYAAKLIHLLCTVIETGGARVQEEVLQSGCIHILASSLRLSLVRANRVNFFSSLPQQRPKDLADVVKRLKRIDDDGAFEVRGSNMMISPRHVPVLIVEACERLVDVCCGPAASSIELLSPADRVVRTSDLALTALFTFALDFDLWGVDAKAAGRLFKSVADRYGDFCITYGYIIRSQVSVQYILDVIRVQYDPQPTSSESEEIGLHLCRLLTAMLLASLSNRRSVTQAEHDVSACIRALTGAPLGSLMAHIILNALVEVLVFCDVLPSEVAIFFTNHGTSDEHKMQVAARMGRNVLMSAFLDVVGPIVLSRTVFAGDFVQKVKTQDGVSSDGSSGSLCWQSHWRVSLLLYSWIASIAGSEGFEAAISTGQLLLASGYAGSLTGAMDDVENDLVSALFLPSPAVAQIIGFALRSNWSYQEMLADRCRIMVPLLPGMVTSLLPRILFGDADVADRALQILSNLLISVGAALQRVYGGINICAGSSADSREKTSEVVKSMKILAPHLFIVALLLENLATVKLSDDTERWEGIILPNFCDGGDCADWSTDGNNSLSSFENVLNRLPAEETGRIDGSTVSTLRLIADSVLMTCAALVNVSFSYGGAGAADSLWDVIMEHIDDFIIHCSVGDLDTGGVFKAETKSTAIKGLCRLVTYILKRSLKREGQWDMWSYEQASAVSTLCGKVDETGLLRQAMGTSLGGKSSFSDDQVSLTFAFLDVLAYGRDMTGWCQLETLPTIMNSSGTGLAHHPSTASKLMLPVLQTCIRTLLMSLDIIDPKHTVALSNARNSVEPRDEYVTVHEKVTLVHDIAAEELDLTLTAAIVGLAFPAACDIALCALAALQRARSVQDSSNVGGSVLDRLYMKVVDELRVRFECEGQLKEKALFDCHDEHHDDILHRYARDDSEAVERLILGNAYEGERGIEQQLIRPDVLHAALDEFSRLGNDSLDVKKDNSALRACVIAWAAKSRAREIDPLTNLFESKLHAGDIRIDNVPDTMATRPFATTVPPVASDTAADAVSNFFECAATEKFRLGEISNRFLPDQRYNRLSYTQRYCWARHMELSYTVDDQLWERSVPDGNRDVRSRIPTVPCCPEFRRFVPSFLDHYADTKSEPIDETKATLEDKRTSLLADMDAFTKNLLETGTLAIVDITKNEIPDEEDELELSVQAAHAPALDFDDEDAEYLPRSDSMNSEEVGELAPPPDDKTIMDTEPYLGSTGSAKTLSLISNSAFSTPPDNSSSSLHLMPSNAGGIEHHMGDCLHVRAEGSRVCSLLLTSSHLILEYEADHDGFYEGEFLAAKEDAQREQTLRDAGEFHDNDPEWLYQHRVELKRREAARLRPQSIRWNLSEVSHIYLRRYRLRDSSLEIFFIPSGGASFGGTGAFSASLSLFLDFGSGRDGLTRRDDMAFSIMQRSPPQAVKQWPDRSAIFLHDQLNRLTLGWAERRITNFDYLLHLNMLAGRSYNDICQYPVFPWVLSNYTSETVPDLNDVKNYRDLSKPIGAINEQRLAEFQERFESFVDPSIPPFMYGSHYSTSAGVVLHFLVRLHPFAGLHRQLQSGHFDCADRLFSSVPRTWSMCTGTSAAEVKELTPEWYCNPAFLRNVNQFKLGTSQDGDVLGDVALPPWANGSADKFVEVMRAALESDICSEMLPSWIDLIFGRKQQGSEAIKANNVFFYLTYYGSVDVASIEDESLRQATELQIQHFGQTPRQLFRRYHIPRFPVNLQHLSFYQCISAYSPMSGSSRNDSMAAELTESNNASLVKGRKPFLGSPISYWVHLDAPPPGPHGALMNVRFAGIDRCLAIDDKGIFHTFRWAWRADELIDTADNENGCFIAQRELPRFRTIPRLMHASPQGRTVAAAISKTLFAGRSVLLVLSDGDGKGGLGMQLVDPSKGSIRGEVLIPAAHSCEITCIVTDPIGTAAGHGGVGGELALVGSADGCASLWRFMSSHYLPLRPRARLAGHQGAKISAVALNSTTHLAATVSAERLCLHSIGNGNLIRSFGPPVDTVSMAEDSALSVVTRFADTPALAISSQGFLVTVCESIIEYTTLTRTVTTLNMFSIEGEFLGSRPMERWRGKPHRMMATPDGTAVLVCSGRGVTVHRLSCCQPLEVIDEWSVTESDDLTSSDNVEHCFDLDLGPSLNRPVAAAAACSNGALRLHALPGISQWSERHKKSSLGSTVGNAFVKPAQTMNRALKEGFNFGSRIAGMGREIGKDVAKEVSTEVKTAGVGGFLGNLMKRRNNAPGS
ncbi:hypothetical protein MPSEU_000410300 [Mayamaea pseudoterrestris]|nr:hypothetical protein MPSEU_000410300 [Mayamaea pseudoterrestris]